MGLVGAMAVMGGDMMANVIGGVFSTGVVGATGAGNGIGWRWTAGAGWAGGGTGASATG